MRIYVFLGIILLGFGCSPLVLDGTYVTPKPETGFLSNGDNFHFFDSNRVEVLHWSDNLSKEKFGEGVFTVKGKNLNIQFDSALSRNPILKDSIFENNAEHLTTYVFNLINKKEEPVIGVEISAFDKNGNEINYSTSNPHGFTKMEIPARKDTLNVTFNFPGYENMKFASNNKQSRIITFLMPHLRDEYQKGEELNYKVKFKKGKLHLVEEEQFRILEKQ